MQPAEAEAAPRRPRPRWLLPALLALAEGAGALEPVTVGAEECNSSAAHSVRLGDSPKVTASVGQGQGLRTSLWAFKPPGRDLRILVTPDGPSVEADAALFTQRDSGVCALLSEAQGVGGDLLLLRNSTARMLNASKIFLRVSCARPGCAYHVSFIAGGSEAADSWQEAVLGESISAAAYHGQPQHFRLDCREECAGGGTLSAGRHLEISAWPRDATSGEGLALLVQKEDVEPLTSPQDHMPVVRGWFSGEVVSTNASRGIYYITVLRRHGRGPLPFVLSARLPETLERLAPGRPALGTVERDAMAFYRFEVAEADADIEVYLTALDGFADIAMSHSLVNAYPRLTSSQWRPTTAHGHVIRVRADDEMRRSNPTGWFHVGVHGMMRVAFSLLVLVVQKAIKTSELWLGTPQLLTVSTDRPASLLFFNQRAISRLFVEVEPRRGSWPNACVVRCGPERGACPAPPEPGAGCEGSGLRAAEAEREAVVTHPCSLCWYAIFVTSPRNLSEFRISLAAEGRAQPLLAGETFQGHVDANDEAVPLVYELSPAIATARALSTLHVVLTPVYGDPMFTVHSGSQDGPLLFDSKEQGRDNFELQLPAASSASLAGAYYFLVTAASKHARFNVQVFWEVSNAYAQWQVLAQLTKAPLKASSGLPILVEGEVQRGMLLGGEPDVYLYAPVNASAGEGDLGISVTPLGEERCRLYAALLPAAAAAEKANEELRRFLASPRLAARWRSGRGEQVLAIRPEELPPAAQRPLLAVAVVPAAGGHGPGAAAARVPYTLEAGPSKAVHQLPATGVPVSGRVAPGQYRRFRISMAEANRSLAVTLQARSGESSLFLGVDANVTRETSLLRSEAYGDNALFVPALSKLNRQHCSEEVLAKRGECAYFIAVFGAGKGAEFEVSAQTGSAAPLRLGPAAALDLAIPPGGRRELVAELVPPLRATALEVSALSGSLSGLRVKVASMAKARHPVETLANSASDFNVTTFAGVWSVQWPRDRITSLCGMVADSSGCAAVIVVESKEGFQGKASLSLTAASGTSRAPIAAEVQAGIPSRTVLRAAGEVAVFGFLARNAEGDLLVSVTPLTNCSASLEVEFPSRANTTKRMAVPPDLRLGFVGTRVSHLDSRFQAGLFHLWVRQERGGVCELDVRAEQEAVGSASESGEPEVAPTVLVVDSPVFASGAHDRYFLFTSRISEAEKAPARERLAVKVATLAGEIVVEAAFSTGGADAASGTFLPARGALQGVGSEDQHGSPGLFVCRGFQEHCGTALLCQVLLRVRSTRAERPADYLVTAMDKLQAEALLPQVPVHGCVGGACPRHSVDKQLYQIHVGNPSTKVHLRLSCLGPDRINACSSLMLSADSRPRLPESLEERAYLPSDSGKDGLLEVVAASSSPSAGKPGACLAPCVLHVQVELRPGVQADGKVIRFELVAAAESEYSLLLDGDDPVSVVVRPSVTEYFMFDSRRATPFLTLVATVPYDREDPKVTLVSMYVLDCGQEATSGHDPELRPSSRHHSHAARVNSRGQLAVLIARPREDQGVVNRDAHCYYRFALVSKRRYPVTLALRAFDWHPHMPLRIDEPIQGAVDAAHNASFELRDSPSAGEDIVLSLEVCSGKLRLQAARSTLTATEGPSLVQDGGLDPRSLKLEAGRRVTVASADGGPGRYSLAAEDPRTRVWLRPTRTEISAEYGRDGQLTLSWGRAWLYRQGQPSRGEGADVLPEAEYEVFYARVGETSANLSTPCGLYLEHERRKMARVSARARRRATIGGLEPGRRYVFNVVARSFKTGASVAYTPFVSRGFPALQPAAAPVAEPGRAAAASWGRWEALLVAGASASALAAWLRPPCREDTPWRRWELELPSWPRRSGRSYRELRGGFAPGAVIGLSDAAGAPYQEVQ